MYLVASVRPSVRLSVCLSVCLSVRLSALSRLNRLTPALPSAAKSKEESLSVQGVCLCVE